MIVVTLTDCPAALRGDLTKWLQEINTNVYVGQVSARVRDEIWERLRKTAKSGKATMVYSANNEQHMDFRVHNTNWRPINFDGLKLMMRPAPGLEKVSADLKSGFSNAAKMRKVRQISGRKQNREPLPETYIVLDLKTTGQSAAEDDIIEIGAVLVKQHQITDNFYALVKAKKKIPSDMESLSGLSDEMLSQEGMELIKVLPEFFVFVGDTPVVSHNAGFIYGFLRCACERCGLPLFSNRCVDTLTLSRRVVDDANNYELTTLLEYFEIEVKDLHRRINACVNTVQLYEKLIELYDLAN